MKAPKQEHVFSECLNDWPGLGDRMLPPIIQTVISAPALLDMKQEILEYEEDASEFQTVPEPTAFKPWAAYYIARKCIFDAMHRGRTLTWVFMVDELRSRYLQEISNENPDNERIKIIFDELDGLEQAIKLASVK